MSERYRARVSSSLRADGPILAAGAPVLAAGAPTLVASGPTPAATASVLAIGVASMAAVIAVLISSGTAEAHHAISAVYDGRQQVTITAVVQEFQFINPHPKILVRAVEDSNDAAADHDGPARESALWTLEMDNRWELAELGFDDETLQPGDRIVVTGSLGRQDERALYVRRLEHAAEDFEYEHHR